MMTMREFVEQYNGCSKHNRKREDRFEWNCPACKRCYASAVAYARRKGTLELFRMPRYHVFMDQGNSRVLRLSSTSWSLSRSIARQVRLSDPARRPTRRAEVTEFVRAHNGCEEHLTTFTHACRACRACYQATLRYATARGTLDGFVMPKKSPHADSPHAMRTRGRRLPKTDRSDGPGLASSRCPACFGGSRHGWACSRCYAVARSSLLRRGAWTTPADPYFVIEEAKRLVKERKLDPSRRTTIASSP